MELKHSATEDLVITGADTFIFIFRLKGKLTSKRSFNAYRNMYQPRNKG